jgi:hypothetical protein
MTEHTSIDLPDQPEMSRRSLLGNLTVAAGAVGLATISGAGSVSAAGGPPSGEALLDPTVAGLTYLPIDAVAFDVAGLNGAQRRIYQEVTGVQPLTAPDEIFASLPLPVGAVLKQINIAYQGTPVFRIIKRALGGAVTELTPNTSLAPGGGPKTQTLAVNAEIVSGATYNAKVFCSAGDSILGMTIGYLPPAQAFVPYAGSAPRVFDSRAGTKFAAGEERVIDLSKSLIPTARAAVVNLTATETAASGFLAAFADGIAWPGNSSLNYTGANQSVANGVIVTMTAGKIKVRCGSGASHVIVDVIGSLL